MDDHRDGAKSLGALLEAMGCHVQTVSSGSEAVKVAWSFRPQLVITELNMPGLNGYETIKQVKQQPWSIAAVFVAYSAEPPQRDPAFGPAVTWFHHYISKPGIPERFSAILDEIRRAEINPDADGLRTHISVRPAFRNRM